MPANQSDPIGFRKAVSIGAGVWITGAILFLIAGEVGLSAKLRYFMEPYTLQKHLGNFLQLHVWFFSGAMVDDAFRILTLLPASLLVAGGFYSAAATRGKIALQNGASVAIGYLAMTTLSIGLQFASHPDLVVAELLLAVFVAGILFPVVFGFLGGLVRTIVPHR